jgi:hypothetical protein
MDVVVRRKLVCKLANLGWPVGAALIEENSVGTR